MKNLLILVLDHGELVDTIFKDLSSAGYNATVLNAISMRHMLEEESADLHFFNISHLEHAHHDASTSCYFIVDEDKLEELKEHIRIQTDNFKKIKGAMFSYKINDYEGTI